MNEEKPPANGEFTFYKFGPFCLDLQNARLFKGQEPVPLVRKAFETLCMLVKHHGQVVSKESLIGQLWPDSFVDEANLTQYIYLLRKTLNCDNSHGEAYIETLHKQGYRFVADVRAISDPPTPAPSESMPAVTVQIEVEATKTNSGKSALTSVRPTYLGLAVIALAIIGVIYLKTRKATLPGLPAETRIGSMAILPFNEVGSDSEHLGLGMADAMITKLAKLQIFPVRPTSAVVGFEGKRIDSVAAGKQLAVDTVMDGTIQRDTDRLRVSVQIINVTSGNQIWADTFEEKFTNLFDVQDAIAERAARSLRLRLSAESRAGLKKRFTSNSEAYQAYLTGYHFWGQRTKEGLFKAVSNFQHAIDQDANYALAYASLADAYLMISYYRYGPMQEYMEKAKAALTKALEIDPTIADAYVSLAEVQRAHKDNQSAEQSLKKAIEIDPYHSTAHMRYGWLLASKLNVVEAEREMRLAQEYDPLSVVNNIALAEVLIFRRNDQEAAKYMERAVDLDPDTCMARATLATIYARQGRYDDAVKLIKEGQQESSTTETALKAFVYARTGRRKEALTVVSRLRSTSDIATGGSYTLGLTYFFLGQKEEAFRWIETALRNNEEPAVVLSYDPDLDEVKVDPRYERIVRRFR